MHGGVSRRNQETCTMHICILTLDQKMYGVILVIVMFYFILTGSILYVFHCPAMSECAVYTLRRQEVGQLLNLVALYIHDLCNMYLQAHHICTIYSNHCSYQN